MLLSSYQRLRRYCAAQSGDALTDNANNRRDLLSWLSPVSAMVENYLNRSLHIEARIDYFDVKYDMKEFYPRGVPITTLTKVESDSTGLWDGGESEITDCYYSQNGNSVIIPLPSLIQCRRGIKITYTGGLALSPVQSVYAMVPTGTMTAEKYVYGSTSSAVGIIKTVAALAITIEVLYGKFEVGETINEWATEDAKGASTATAVLGAATSLSLAEGYPEIVRACELQLRYLWSNKDRLELASTNKDGTQSKRSPGEYDLRLQPEAVILLNPYRMMSV